MTKPIREDAKMVELPFPRGGIDISTEFELQPPETTPAGLNVRAFEPDTRRARGGARGGLAKYVNAQVGGVSSVIQHLNYIVDPQGGALMTGDDTASPGYTVLTIDQGRYVPLTVSPAAFSQIDDPSSNAAGFGPGAISNPAGRVPSGRAVRLGGSGVQINRSRRTQRRAPIAYVQSNHGVAIFGSPAIAAFPADVSSASLLLVAVMSIGDEAGAVASVQDSLGNSYTQAGGYLDTQAVIVTLTFGRLSLWYYISVGAGPNTVTATVGGANTTTEAVILEYTGVAAMAFGPLDGLGTSTGSVDVEGPVTTGPVTVGADGELLFGLFYTGANFAPDPAFTQRTNSLGLASADQIGPAPGSPAVTGTASGASGYLAIGASFKPS